MTRCARCFPPSTRNTSARSEPRIPTVQSRSVGSRGSAGERLVIILIVFGYMTIASIISVIGGHREFEYTNAAVLEVLLIELALGGAAAILLQRNGWTLRDFGFEISARGTLAAAALYFGTNFVCAVVYLFTSQAGLLTGWADTPVRFVATPALMLLFLVVNSFFEELFVVGYLIEATPASEAAFAVSVSALVRLLYHTYQGPLAIATILPLGVIFAAVYLKWRNLWPLVLAHTAMNVAGWAAD